MKLVVGLGCSWTQGEGAYPEHLWKKHNGRINLPIGESINLIPFEHLGSWVNVLSRDYFKNYTSVNLGQRGIGNRAAAKSLYLSNIDWNTVTDAIVVYMLSGFERFDFFRNDWNDTVQEKLNPHKDIPHYNFQTLWPHLGVSKPWNAYARYLYSEEGTAAEQLVNILEVQNFCKAHNFKFVFANAFEDRGKEFIYKHCGKLADQVDWSCYIHDYRNYANFVHHLVELDNWLPRHEIHHYYGHYIELPEPKKHLTNCIHPTIDGYKAIAEELASFIKEKYPTA